MHLFSGPHVSFRSVEDLNRCLVGGLHRIPWDVDLVAA
jgi:hypothetical protein